MPKPVTLRNLLEWKEPSFSEYEQIFMMLRKFFYENHMDVVLDNGFLKKYLSSNNNFRDVLDCNDFMLPKPQHSGWCFCNECMNFKRR